MNVAYSYGGFITIMSVINIAPFLIWLSLIEVEVVHPNRNSEYILNAFSVQITVLEVVLVAIGFALAMLGLFSYQGI